MSDAERTYTVAELAQFDGKDGRPMYVAYKGVVYDVSQSKLWKLGTHMRKHAPGGDLTRELLEAPHGEEVFTRVPRVGTLQTPVYERRRERERDMSHLPPAIAGLLHRIPFLERHPHPMTVHFPIALGLATPVFALLYVATGIPAFEFTAVNTLAGSAFFTLVAIVTGFLTWWINYGAGPARPVVIKISLSVVMLVDSVAALVWRALDPGVLMMPSPGRWVYLGMLVVLLPIVGIIGWYGASLTFPMQKKHRQ